MHQKGEARGNASYYYSFTRMKSRGTIALAGKIFTVSGESWMDHEFSSSFLEPAQQGWDWFALQLDDGSELMLYQMRRNDGTPIAIRRELLSMPTGLGSRFGDRTSALLPERNWTSAASKAAYPIQWNETPIRAASSTFSCAQHFPVRK